MTAATLYSGNVLAVLAGLPERSVQTCVTSPPYWGLRDYGTPPMIWGGLPDCSHEWAAHTYHNRGGKGGQGATSVRFGRSNVGGQERLTVHAGTCPHCGAWRGHLGLEPTPELYVEHMVEVFRAVWRVLRDDGVLWLNLGDSYNNVGGLIGGGMMAEGRQKTIERTKSHRAWVPGLKPKDLIGIPWLVAFSLRADGWYLRSDIIWSKPNPMPESVTDRPTKSHEYLFLLSKGERYYYDAQAIVEPFAEYDGGSEFYVKRGIDWKSDKHLGNADRNDGQTLDKFSREGRSGRNARSVWTIATQSYSGAHFATFPEELARRCILAGSSAKACEHCGAPWERVTEQTTRFEGGSGRAGRTAEQVNGSGKWRNGGEAGNANLKLGPTVDRQTVGWQAGCPCEANTGTAQSIVLDPFGGSGTTAAVAVGHGRRAVHIDLNPAYLPLARERIGPMLCHDSA